MLTECVTGAYILYAQKVDWAILTNKTESLQFFNPLQVNQFSDFFFNFTLQDLHNLLPQQNSHSFHFFVIYARAGLWILQNLLLFANLKILQHIICNSKNWVHPGHYSTYCTYGYAQTCAYMYIYNPLSPGWSSPWPTPNSLESEWAKAQNINHMHHMRKWVTYWLRKRKEKQI